MSGPVGHRPAGTSEHSTGELVKEASAQLSELVRSEMRLAQAELTEKGKRAGIGGGLFGGAGVAGFLGLQALLVAAGAALALVMPVWGAALIVAAVMFAVAGVMALTGKKQIAQATPPMPEEAVSSVKADVEEIKGRVRR
ncbi:phage holin family protein [Streptomyces sp. 549]|uniref:phage holin family protein n=1 Tax=Streptomyces sp. 549 TaxID=3049076 RepID=UPI0024C28393|nr:phage holin family protein [Streptomyces sp. 549]MDK1474807.1 phage holin family protein [Streptomyces sp. 549]